VFFQFRLGQYSVFGVLFQIGSITVNMDKEGTCNLLASQPGGTYVTLHHDPSKPQHLTTDG